MQPQDSLISSLDSKYLKQVLSFLQPAEVVKLASTTKQLRNSIRHVVLRDMKLEYSESRRRICKNFFQIIKNSYCKKIIKFSKEEFIRLFREPKAKDIKYEVKPFFVGERITVSKVGPKFAGYLTDRSDLLLISIKDLEKLVFSNIVRIKDVRRFEVSGWCVVEKHCGGLFGIGFADNTADIQEKRLPNFFDEKFSQLVAWTSGFDKIAVAYRHNTTSDEHSIYVAGISEEDEPAKIDFKGEIGSMSIGKFKLLVSEKSGVLHSWDIEDKLSHETHPAANVKQIFSNAILSFLCTRNNKMKRLEDFNNEELVKWFQYLRLSRFEDIIKYSKITGEVMSKFGRAEYEKLLGFPPDSPEVNHLYLHNRLLSKDYFKTPELLAHGYNGNNELGISTGNQMIADFQEFSIPLNDYADDIVDVKIGGLTSFMTTFKGRRYCCLEAEEKQSNSNKQDKEEKNAKNQKGQPEAEQISEEDSEEEGQRGKKKKASRKGSKTIKQKEEKKSEKAPEKKTNQKKFEKMRWREITELFAETPVLRNFQIDQLDSSKNHVFVICHDKFLAPGDENSKNQLLSIGNAVTKVLHDPKLKTHTFDVGMRNS